MPSQVTAGNESNFSPDLSADGEKVVFTSDKKVNKDIWIKRASGGYAKALTHHSADDFSPVLSPKGDKIAFVSRRLDATGNIHILDLGFSFGKTFSSSEGSLDVIDLPSSEDMTPSWFPDGKQIVFAARRFTGKEPDILVGNLKDLQAKQLGSVTGNQPAVSQDGNMIVYIHDGGIHIYYLDSGKVARVTEGGLVQDSEPRFTNADQSIVFTRYADDTNSDGKLDGEDHKTIWTTDIPKEEKRGVSLENFAMVPLTNAKFAAYAPEIRGDVILFALQNDLGLNIYKLPKNGQLPQIASFAAAVNLFDALGDFDEKTLVLRRAISDLWRSNRRDEAREAILMLFRWFVRNGKAVEAEMLKAKLQKNLPDDAVILAMADLNLFELTLSQWAFPKVNRQPGPDEEAALQKLLLQTKSLKIPASPNQGETSRIIGYRSLIEAKILASLRKFFEADQLLTEITSKQDLDERLRGEAEIFAGLVAREMIGNDIAIQRLVKVVEHHPKLRTLAREASQEIIAIVSDSRDPMEALSDVRNTQRDLPILPALAHLQVALAFETSGKHIVAANELRHLLLRYPRSPEIVLEAAEKIVEIMEASGRIDELESLMFDMHEQFQKENPKFAPRARAILISMLIRKGAALVRRGNLDGATTAYQMVTALDPSNTAALRGIIDAAHRQGKLDLMMNDLEDGAEEEPISAEDLYIYGYARTYEIDQAKSPGSRISRINSCIKILERARELNSQSVHIHQTLGWLYFQKGTWIERHEASGAIAAKTRRSWNIFSGFFGWPEPDWFELAIDSYSAAYFLAEPDSVEKANIAQNLGNAYYLSKNFQKATVYYMARIKMLARLPASDPVNEAVILSQAGRAAFHADELTLAGSIQKPLVPGKSSITKKWLESQSMPSPLLCEKIRNTTQRSNSIKGSSEFMSSDTAWTMWYPPASIWATRTSKWITKMMHSETSL
jgi:tetratricopeptide (TPR) repeat protein